jgi:hypothetical protein
MLRPFQIPHRLSKGARKKGVEALTSFFFSILVAAAPIFSNPILGFITKIILKKIVGVLGEASILGINRSIINSSVNRDLADVLDVWDRINMLTDDLTIEEIRVYEDEQIKASNRFLSLGRKRL